MANPQGINKISYQEKYKRFKIKVMNTFLGLFQEMQEIEKGLIEELTKSEGKE